MLRGRRHLLLPLGLGVALLAALVALARQSGAAPRRAPPRRTATVWVGARPFGRPLPADFLGFSIEYTSALSYFGTNPAAPNPTFIRLVRALTPTGSPSLRFGGDTTDWTWWPVPGMQRPRGIRYTLSSRWLRVTRATAAALHARLILGINLEADSRPLAAIEAKALVNGLGRSLIASLELGNEPEVYGSIGWYTDPAGQAVLGRPSGYNFRSYVPDYESTGAVLPQNVPLAGPASGAPKWVAGAGRFLAADPRVRMATFHFYPLHRCDIPPTSPTTPSIGHLMSLQAGVAPAQFFARAVAAAHAQGRVFRVDEVNSVSCKGAPGISDTFASALWAVDALFHLFQVGVDGVNVHMLRGADYAPFSFRRTGSRWHATVRPLYYGLLLFARAVPAGSRLLATTQRRDEALRAWATEDRRGTLRVVLINTSAGRAQTVGLRLPATGRTATLERLLAPRLSAKTGITLGGQTYGPTTDTGQLSGRLRTALVHPLDRRYVVRLGPASAAVLVVSAR
jgi:Glycosyl hydrolase family 79 C-terminal beta domain